MIAGDTRQLPSPVPTSSDMLVMFPGSRLTARLTPSPGQPDPGGLGVPALVVEPGACVIMLYLHYFIHNLPMQYH